MLILITALTMRCRSCHFQISSKLPTPQHHQIYIYHTTSFDFVADDCSQSFTNISILQQNTTSHTISNRHIKQLLIRLSTSISALWLPLFALTIITHRHPVVMIILRRCPLPAVLVPPQPPMSPLKRCFMTSSAQSLL